MNDGRVTYVGYALIFCATLMGSLFVGLSGEVGKWVLVIVVFLFVMGVWVFRPLPSQTVTEESPKEEQVKPKTMTQIPHMERPEQRAALRRMVAYLAEREANNIQ